MPNNQQTNTDCAAAISLPDDVNALIGYEIKVLDHGFVRLVDYMGSDQRICEAARVSYRSPSKGPEQDKKLINYLWANQHTSPFEQCILTFNVKMPIFVMRQHIRHRTQSVNEVSGRYTVLPDEFYVPTRFRRQDAKNKQSSQIIEDWPDSKHEEIARKITDLCNNAFALYRGLLDAGVAREQARIVLPFNVYTEFYCTWNLRNLLHYIDLRENPDAQYEIQVYALAFKRFCEKLFPMTMAAYEKKKNQPF